MCTYRRAGRAPDPRRADPAPPPAPPAAAGAPRPPPRPRLHYVGVAGCGTYGCRRGSKVRANDGRVPSASQPACDAMSHWMACTTYLLRTDCSLRTEYSVSTELSISTGYSFTTDVTISSVSTELSISSVSTKLSISTE